MANRDDDRGAPKPLFLPPPKLGEPAKPGVGSSLFAPAPAFGQWPDAPVERAASLEDTRPIEVTKPVEPVEASKPASSSASGLRPPVHARKTSTQAHAVVGEFGVPSPSDSKPTTPIVDQDDDAASRDDLPRARPIAGSQRRSRTTAADDDPDDPERTDEDPKPIVIEHSAANDPPGKRSSLPLLIGAGLAATLIAAIVVGMQDRGSADPSADPPKPNRSEANEAGPTDVSPRETQPRQPGDTKTKLGDSDTRPAEHGSTTTGSERSETDTGGDAIDPRDPSVIPPGTPEENVKVFLKLPVSIHDGPPLGGIGRSGIHIDAITTGREYRSGECKDEVREFSVATDKEVSVCFRVVHDREEEGVRVLWDKDGVTTRRGGVRIRDLHAYKTRAYLELRPEYVGTWRVRVISEDDVELAAFEFEIGP